METAENNLVFLKEVYSLLLKEGIETFVFGGWAEELRSVSAPRQHRDIDLLYKAKDFSAVDSFINKHGLKIIKEFPHKRAFLYKGVMIELFLVNANRNTTNFFSQYLYQWQDDAFDENMIDGMKVCGKTTLLDYRQKHRLVEEVAETFFK